MYPQHKTKPTFAMADEPNAAGATPTRPNWTRLPKLSMGKKTKKKGRRKAAERMEADQLV